MIHNFFLEYTKHSIFTDIILNYANIMKSKLF